LDPVPNLDDQTVDPPIALTIAGSDSGGGAGLQTDLKTFAMHGVFGTSVVTVLTAQNTVAIRALFRVPVELVVGQLAAVLEDLPVAGVKTGMLGSAEIADAVAEWAPRLPRLVVDPVLVDSRGERLFTVQTERVYLERLFPHAAVITPNTREAAVLLGREVSTVEQAVRAGEELAGFGPAAVVVKGGRLRDGTDAVDVVVHGGRVELLRSPWVETANNHGSGDAFAAATAARLARGEGIDQAIAGAKTYVHAALRRSAGWRLGGGHGPVGWHPA
jgi:hydroxymethylpyrimidine/phosphomethylpyrimidine kinase